MHEQTRTNQFSGLSAAVRRAAWLMTILSPLAAAAQELRPAAARLAEAQAHLAAARPGDGLAVLAAGPLPPALRCEAALLRAELQQAAGRAAEAQAALAALEPLACNDGVRLAAARLVLDLASAGSERARQRELIERWIALRSEEYRRTVELAAEGKTSLHIQKVFNRDGAELAEAWQRLLELRRAAGDTAGAQQAAAELYLRYPHTPQAQKLEAMPAGLVASEKDLYARARILAALGRLESAVIQLEELAKSAKDPEVLRRTLLQLGELNERRREGPASARALERLLTLVEPAGAEGQRARYLLARTYYRRFSGRDARALELLEGLASASDASIARQALQFRVGLLDEKDRESEAIALLEAEAGRAGSAARQYALDKLGWMRFLRKDWQGSLAAYEALLELPVEPETRAAALYWSGRALEKLGRNAPARQRFARAAAELPLYWYGLRSEARLEEDGAEPREPLPALPLVERYQRQSLPPARAPKIEALLAQKLARFARWELEQVLSEEPDNLKAAFHLARLHAAEQDFETSATVANRAFGSLRYYGPRRVPRELLELLYPLAYQQSLRRYASLYGVPAPLVAGLIHQESGWFSHVVSGAGAVGLMQLMPVTARKMARQAGIEGYSDARLAEPDLNLRLGIYYLSRLLRTFDGAAAPAVASYNAGPGKAGGWWRATADRDLALFAERIGYSETRDYVKKVLGKAEAYRQLYPELSRSKSP